MFVSSRTIHRKKTVKKKLWRNLIFHVGGAVEYVDPLQLGSKHFQKGCPEYDTKLHLMVRPQFWRSGEMWRTPSLSLLPGPFLSRVVVPVRVPYMGQIDVFKNYSYSIGLCAKITSPKKQQYKKYRYKHTNERNSLTSRSCILPPMILVPCCVTNNRKSTPRTLETREFKKLVS